MGDNRNNRTNNNDGAPLLVCKRASLAESRNVNKALCCGAVVVKSTRPGTRYRRSDESLDTGSRADGR